VTDAATSRARLRRRLPTVLEIALAIALAFVLGRLTVGSSSSSPRPGAVDVGFSQDMAVHHEQAVLMAGLAQTRGGSAVAALADAILTTQSQEIGLTRGWLKVWGKAATNAHPMAWMPAAANSMPGMTMAPAELPAGSTAMPGMASPAQLGRLAHLTGRRFDVLFLQLMIRHHQGGLQMCRFTETHATLALVRDAARSMAFEQVQDLAQLRALLAADGAAPLPAP